MQIAFINLIVLVGLTVGFNAQAEKAKSNRKPTALADDLAAVTGSYSLEKGKPSNCPEGEFTGGKDFLVVGSGMKIEKINHSAVESGSISGGECQVSSKADFDGKKLVYSQTEKCGESSHSHSTHSFDFYSTATTKYVKLNFNKSTLLKDSHQSTFTFECLYSADLK